MIARPAPDEYVDYYHQYISKVPEGDILEVLTSQIEETSQLLDSIPEERGGYRYADGKWSIKQVVGHLIDVERIFQVRALVFARNDPAPMPGMEQDDYVTHANFDARRLRDLAEEFRAVRRAGILMFRSFEGDMTERRGVASGFTFSVRAVPYILAGHERHHRTVLRERYLG